MMQPIVLRLPEGEKRLLELEAKKEGVSMAEITRKALRTYLREKSDERPSGAEVMLKWAKRSEKYESRFHDKNLSTTYKQYLYGPKSKKFGYLWKKNK